MKGASASAYYARIAAWLRRDAALQPLLAAFESREIDVIPLKGWAVQRVYPQPEERSMGDVDLLVRQADFLKAAQLLRTHGYKLIEITPAVDPEIIESQAVETWPSTLTFRSPNGLELDLHQNLLSNRWLGPLFKIPMDAVWEAAVAVEPPETFFQQLAPYDMLAHLCLHNGSHAFQTAHSHKDIDLWVRNKMAQQDWEMFVARVQSWGSGVLSYWVMYYCRETLGTPVPEDVLQALKPGRFKLALAQVFKGKTARTHPSLGQWIVTDRWGAMLQVALGILFPERVYLQARYEGQMRIIRHWKRFARLGFGG